jgi:hypothetical protein
MNDYRREILGNLKADIEGVYWVELGDMTREFLGYYETLKGYTTIEDGYIITELPNDYELVIGFGDTEAEFWNGVLYWQIYNDTKLGHYSGEITNGSPRFIFWTLFEQLEEALSKKGN